MTTARCHLCETLGIHGDCPHGAAMDPEDTSTKDIRAGFEEAFPEGEVLQSTPGPKPEQTLWKQERPSWCPHKDTCVFARRAMDALCGGKLQKPEPHAPGEAPVNTHRFCTNLDQSPDVKRVDIIDLQVNDADLDWFRWIFDALDGRETSHLNRRRVDGGASPA